MPRVLFSLTTTAKRAPFIAPCLGSLAATKNAEVCIASDLPLGAFPFPAENVYHARVNLLGSQLPPIPEGPFHKYLGVPYDLNPDYVLVCDDDNVYPQSVIAAILNALCLSDGNTNAAFQGRHIGGIFKPGRADIKWFGTGAPFRVDILTGSSMVGFHYSTWLALRERVLTECMQWSPNEKLADDYCISRILRKMRVNVFALNVPAGFPYTYALPYHNLGDALHHTDGGNNKRYKILAEDDERKGDTWWR